MGLHWAKLLDLALPALVALIMILFPQVFFKPRPLVLDFDRKTRTVRRFGFAILAGSVGLYFLLADWLRR